MSQARVVVSGRQPRAGSGRRAQKCQSIPGCCFTERVSEVLEAMLTEAKENPSPEEGTGGGALRALEPVAVGEMQLWTRPRPSAAYSPRATPGGVGNLRPLSLQSGLTLLPASTLAPHCPPLGDNLGRTDAILKLGTRLQGGVQPHRGQAPAPPLDFDAPFPDSRSQRSPSSPQALTTPASPTAPSWPRLLSRVPSSRQLALVPLSLLAQVPAWAPELGHCALWLILLKGSRHSERRPAL